MVRYDSPGAFTTHVAFCDGLAGYWEEEQADPDAVVYEEEERYELNGIDTACVVTTDMQACG